jgi:hypothetical protein
MKHIRDEHLFLLCCAKVAIVDSWSINSICGAHVGIRDQIDKMVKNNPICLKCLKEFMLTYCDEFKTI